MFLLFSEQDEWCRSYTNMDQVNAAIAEYVVDQEEFMHYKVIDISNAKTVKFEISWSE